jgi:hypothetical protein
LPSLRAPIRTGRNLGLKCGMSDQHKPAQNACYSDSAWLDHARGLTRDDVATAMQKHLANGCSQCEAMLALWTKTYNSARKGADHEPPNDVVLSVKRAFAISRRLPFFESLAVAAYRVFDTFLQPAPAGVRSVVSPSRHIVHQSGEIIVDIKIDDEHGAFACLTGQVLVGDEDPGHAAGTLVFLIAGQDRLVAQASANEIGEFQMDVEYGPELKLYLQLPTGKLISVVLSNDVFRAAP